MNNPQSIRLNKFLAERLGVSRREADNLIASGQVTVNGDVARLGTRIDVAWTGDGSGGAPAERQATWGGTVPAGPVQKMEIRCRGKVIPYANKYMYLAFNKPVGYVCSRRAQGKTPTLYDLLPKKYHHLKTVGRLDKDSSGLILLTNDGDFAFQMTHPKFRKSKVYEVNLDHPLEPLHQQMISDFGVLLDDGPSKFTVMKNEVETPLSRGFRSLARRELAREPHGDGRERRDPRKMVSQPQYTVFLSEGRNRQIRRTFASLGYKVTRLHRTQFGKYELGNLKSGKCVIIEP